MRTSVRRIVESGLWVAAGSAISTAVLALLAAVFGDGLLTLKYLLFVFGFLYFGIGTFGMRSRLKRRPETIDRNRTPYLESEEEWDLEARLQLIPPLRTHPLPFDDRVSRNAKLFLTGLVLLGISLVMEVVLGIRVGAA